jgi:hypothetical protein
MCMSTLHLPWAPSGNPLMPMGGIYPLERARNMLCDWTRMPPSRVITCGFVPSLEAMPLLCQAPSHGEEQARWAFKSFPSYSRILLNLLTGELASGLVPWELFATEILARPKQRGLWAVPLVVHACPTELVLGHRAQKILSQPRTKKGSASTTLAPLVFAIEARRSLTRLQIAAWLSTTAGWALQHSEFKVLPMDLMLRGLEAGEIDGLVAATPWGLWAETLGSGTVAQGFTQGEFSQEMVLVCARNTVGANASFFQSLPKVLQDHRAQLAQPDVFARTAAGMAHYGTIAFDISLLGRAAALHLTHVKPRDFTPDAAFLEKVLKRLADFSLLRSGLGNLSVLAAELSP